MVAEFLADEAPGVVKARHPFVFFVTAFGGLGAERIAVKASGSTGPPKPSPGPTYKQPRCNLHEENPRARASNVDWCPSCREHKARDGTREGAPKTAAEILTGDRPP